MQELEAKITQMEKRIAELEDESIILRKALSLHLDAHKTEMRELSQILDTFEAAINECR